jgi:hypothetical protein
MAASILGVYRESRLKKMRDETVNAVVGVASINGDSQQWREKIAHWLDSQLRPF